MKRGSGVLMHITSLPNDYGIGTFGKEAYEFVDFLYKSNQRYWQILPLGSTGYGDSPYQSFSAFDGNPYFIDFRILEEEGVLTSTDYENMYYSKIDTEVDYELIFLTKNSILRKAYENFKYNTNDDFEQFKTENASWISDYAFFRALKDYFDFKPWWLWTDDIKNRKNDALNMYFVKLKEDIDFYSFLQFQFFKQWSKLKAYANSKGIDIIGDLPIYVAQDSADVWVNGELFKLNQNKECTVVSGCPPDYFAHTGQLWGNPIYDWDFIKSAGYDWWIKRLQANVKLYDIIRLDHFIGYVSYWEISANYKTAERGNWAKGPGKDFFEKIFAHFGDKLKLIAEDLGNLSKEVIELREQYNIPGMKILQFAFGDDNSQYLPHNYTENSIVYIGTHDNDTIDGWLKGIPDFKQSKVKKYFNLTEDEGYNWGMIRGAMSSIAKISIFQMQDILNLDTSSRMNIPSTVGLNWTWRAAKNDMNIELAHKIAELTTIFGR